MWRRAAWAAKWFQSQLWLAKKFQKLGHVRLVRVTTAILVSTIVFPISSPVFGLGRCCMIDGSGKQIVASYRQVPLAKDVLIFGDPVQIEGQPLRRSDIKSLGVDVILLPVQRAFWQNQPVNPVALAILVWRVKVGERRGDSTVERSKAFDRQFDGRRFSAVLPDDTQPVHKFAGVIRSSPRTIFFSNWGSGNFFDANESALDCAGIGDLLCKNFFLSTGVPSQNASKDSYEEGSRGSYGLTVPVKFFDEQSDRLPHEPNRSVNKPLPVFLNIIVLLFGYFSLAWGAGALMLWRNRIGVVGGMTALVLGVTCIGHSLLIPIP